MSVAGFTSTGSKHPDVFYGGAALGAPTRMMSSAGCTTRGDDGHDYLDFVMALGSVSLGYAHPDVTAAVVEAVARGGIGALAPLEEEATAADIKAIMPWMEEVRFFKSGAEAVAGAVRLARAATGRDRILGCGYHGWLDWCSEGEGVPASTRDLYSTVEFNDIATTVDRIRQAGDRLAAVVIEPVILAEPDPAWLLAMREETARVGAVLIFDEIKTGFRVAKGGASERWGVQPDLTVLGKALANGFPLGAVGGSASVMGAVRQTWISSTMATEFVSLAAARAAMRVTVDRNVPAHLQTIGTRLHGALQSLCDGLPDGSGISVRGIAEMCHLEINDPAVSHAVAVGCARRGLLWKRGAYNFVSLAHDAATIDRAVGILHEVVADAVSGGRP
jgi:glutamate-1-semialdehyde 2,1-aminomutase